jgi:K+-transporting ATPase ATPase B chain
MPLVVADGRRVLGVIERDGVVGPLLLLAIPGVKARRHSASSLSRGRLVLYGLVGMMLPWAGIKVIDVWLNAWR